MKFIARFSVGLLGLVTGLLVAVLVIPSVIAGMVSAPVIRGFKAGIRMFDDFTDWMPSMLAKHGRK